MSNWLDCIKTEIITFTCVNLPGYLLLLHVHYVTHSNIMGKTQRGKSNDDTRQGPYDLCMPKNWTIKQLRTALETKGISFTKSEKKSQLISF